MGGTTDVSKKIYSGERAFMDTLKTMSLGNMMEDENETDNLENSLDDQADGICASHVLEQPIDPPEGYVGSSSRTLPFASEPTPDQKTVIFISHAYQTDTEDGDYFGATLYTYMLPSGKKYKYQHLLKDIKDGYPAQKMRICEGDQLDLIGKKFTPDLNHTEVLNSFHHKV
ncbi:hypothetical protein DPMN_138131 [Dreissena polymorpha]|uniref:Uncharacterized protein n=1 Tax=Dreissena polymorpha TaxID=45954 RepID=A0A9D4G3A5_DREPO|nr:hypothetical protein DPMN_138131 [Dreissena polymorpha]